MFCPWLIFVSLFKYKRRKQFVIYLIFTQQPIDFYLLISPPVFNPFIFFSLPCQQFLLYLSLSLFNSELLIVNTSVCSIDIAVEQMTLFNFFVLFCFNPPHYLSFTFRLSVCFCRLTLSSSASVDLLPLMACFLTKLPRNETPDVVIC